MALKRGNEIATIDVVLVTLEATDPTTGSPIELALNTSSKIGVNPQVETVDAIKLVIKGKLIAQKPTSTTITGNTIVLTDNVFNPEVVRVLQGGTLEYDSLDPTSIKKYTPPLAGSDDKGLVSKLCAYTAQYDAAGLIVKYEKITYPNCQGTPISLSSEDNVFRVSEYTINSAPKQGEAPYTIEYLTTLPTVS